MSSKLSDVLQREGLRDHSLWRSHLIVQVLVISYLKLG